MAVQIPYSIYTEIQKKSNIRTVQGKHRKDTAAAVQLQRRGNHRRTSDERPYPHAGQHTAKIQRVGAQRRGAARRKTVHFPAQGVNVRLGYTVRAWGGIEVAVTAFGTAIGDLDVKAKHITPHWTFITLTLSGIEIKVNLECAFATGLKRGGTRYLRRE